MFLLSLCCIAVLGRPCESGGDQRYELFVTHVNNELTPGPFFFIKPLMNPKSAGGKASKRGPNFEKNLRPASSRRVTFALGLEPVEQADRIARSLSSYQDGGVSRTAVIRGILRYAENIALQSGDTAVTAVLANSQIPESGKLPKISKLDKECARIWKVIRGEILKG